jgi:hypothetical protein
VFRVTIFLPYFLIFLIDKTSGLHFYPSFFGVTVSFFLCYPPGMLIKEIGEELL